MAAYMRVTGYDREEGNGRVILWKDARCAQKGEGVSGSGHKT